MAGSYDHARRKKAQRRQKRERGVWVYIPHEELAAAGRSADDTLPWYRVWAGPRGSVMVTLYNNP